MASPGTYYTSYAQLGIDVEKMYTESEVRAILERAAKIVEETGGVFAAYSLETAARRVREMPLS